MGRTSPWVGRQTDRQTAKYMDSMMAERMDEGVVCSIYFMVKIECRLPLLSSDGLIRTGVEIMIKNGRKV